MRTDVGPHRWAGAHLARMEPPPINSVAERRAGGAYQIVTPEECLAMARSLGPDGHLILRPLFGGTEPDAAWTSLDLFEAEVLPHLDVPAA